MQTDALVKYDENICLFPNNDNAFDTAHPMTVSNNEHKHTSSSPADQETPSPISSSKIASHSMATMGRSTFEQFPQRKQIGIDCDSIPHVSSDSISKQQHDISMDTGSPDNNQWSSSQNWSLCVGFSPDGPDEIGIDSDSETPPTDSNASGERATPDFWSSTVTPFGPFHEQHVPLDPTETHASHPMRKSLEPTVRRGDITTHFEDQGTTNGNSLPFDDHLVSTTDIRFPLEAIDRIDTKHKTLETGGFLKYNTQPMWRVGYTETPNELSNRQISTPPCGE